MDQMLESSIQLAARNSGEREQMWYGIGHDESTFTFGPRPFLLKTVARHQQNGDEGPERFKTTSGTHHEGVILIIEHGDR
jgi:hypothetical protein